MYQEILTYVFKEKKGKKERFIELYNEELFNVLIMLKFIETKINLKGETKWKIATEGKKMYLSASGEYKKINQNSFSFKFKNFIRKLKKEKELYF